MARNSKLARAIKLALLTGATAGGTGVISTAQGQEAEVEEITVTGSRIVRQDYDATSPVFTLDSDAFRDAGTPQIEQVLNALPQLVPSLTTTSNNPGSGGQAWLDLRGLGTARTLVLLDGARMQPSNTTSVVDLNTIPAAMIESVEILTGGSSAAYGSDAIAGVVNVKLRRDFEGVLLSGLTTQSAESDGMTNAISLLLGGNLADDRGNIVLSFNYDRREEVFGAARDFSRVALGAGLTPLGSTSIPEGAFVPAGSNAPTQAAYDAVFGAGAVPSTSSIAFNTDGSVFSMNPVVGYTGDTSDIGFNATSYSYNFAPANYLQLPLERRQIAAFGHFAMTEDVEVYARMMYTNYNSDVELAATPISSGIGSTMPVTNQFIPADLADILASRPNPLDDFTLTKRTLDVGPRTGENSWDVMQGQVGVRGDFEMLENSWRWDAFATWGKTQRTELQGGNVSRSRLNAAYYNIANTSLTANGCTGVNGLNPFGIGNISAACAAAVGIKATNVTELEQTNIVASLTGGLFELPAGTVQTAVGMEYRENIAQFRPDEFLASGDVVGFNAARPVDGAIDVTEIFTEFSVPLLGDMTLVNYLGLDAAYRYSDYSTAGGVDTYMLGLDYQPTETIKLRTSFNQATRAPNVGELYTPPSESFPQYSDPCWNGSTERTGPDGAQVDALCQAQGAFANFPQGNAQVRAILGGNVDLEPETADTYTIGLVWQPTFGDNDLRLAVDWFRYEITETIGTVGASSIVSRCYNQQGANPTYDINNIWCTLFTRRPSGEATDVRANNQNLGQRNVDGIDAQADYGFDLGPGSVDVGLALTYLLKWELQEDPAAPLARVEGTITNALAQTFPELKGRLSVGYAFSDYNVRWTMNYIDGMDVVNNNAARTDVNPLVALAPTVDSYMYHRLTGSWAITDDISLMLGIDNLTDEDPPIYTADNGAGVQSNTDPSTYDVLGRRYFLSADFRFGGN